MPNDGYDEAKKDLDNGGWRNCAMYVLEALRELKANQRKLIETQARLEMRVVMYGVIAGFVAGGGVTLIAAWIGRG
jgi:hypothetical protein